jgi:hypothetical protein
MGSLQLRFILLQIAHFLLRYLLGIRVNFQGAALIYQ